MTHPYTILIPHYKTKITAYTVYKILQHSKGRDINIVVIDNSNGEGCEYLEPFRGSIKIIPYPRGIMQSHGLAYEFALENGYVNTEWFVTLESDSYPTADNWLTYYDDLIGKGYDSAGSLLTLSGGVFQHAAGSIYRKSIWQEAKAYVATMKYTFFPNMATKEGSDFGYHLMVKNHILVGFALRPALYIDLHHSYKDCDTDCLDRKMKEYQPIADSVFHNGMGDNQESIITYTQRNIFTEPAHVLLDNESDIIYRVGEEPGQWICYYQLAMGKQLFYIPTEVKWLKGRHGQQQEYTLMENGVKHLWGVSAYHKCDAEALQDIVRFKDNQMNELYDSMPGEVKLKEGVS